MAEVKQKSTDAGWRGRWLQQADQELTSILCIQHPYTRDNHRELAALFSGLHSLTIRACYSLLSIAKGAVPLCSLQRSCRAQGIIKYLWNKVGGIKTPWTFVTDTNVWLSGNHLGKIMTIIQHKRYLRLFSVYYD